MNKKLKEKIKLFILIILVLSSILQVGILWNNGFPAFFGVGPDNSSQKLDATARSEIFMPYKLSLCDGNEKHWVISKSDRNYTVLWEETKNYLKKVVESSPSQILDESQWSDLVSKKSLIFEFKSSIDINLTAWFLNTVAKTSNGPEGVYKILISPWEDAKINTYSIYIFDGTKVYKYNLQMEKLSKKFYDDIITNYKSNLSLYGMTGIEKMPFSVKPDILGITQGSKIKEFSSLTCTLPGDIKEKAYTWSELLNIAKNIIGTQVYSYDRYVNPDDNTAKFTTVNDAYSIYSDGLLEYNNIQVTGQEGRGKIEDAFKNAYKLISNIHVLNSNAGIYLSGIKKDKDWYTFTFDYIIGEYPIFFDYQRGGKNEVLTNAVTIQANDKVVSNCKWIMRNFENSKEKNIYDASLRDFFNIPDKTFKVLRNDKKIFVTDIISSYVVTDIKESTKISPTWIINTNGKNYYVPMER